MCVCVCVDYSKLRIQKVPTLLYAFISYNSLEKYLIIHNFEFHTGISS
jgi:hypothetical protein